MTRGQVLVKRPTRTLGALSIALLAAGVAVGSGADFSSRTANPSNTFTAGTLKMDNSRDAAAILEASGMKPGGAPQTGTVDIQNKGSLGAVFKLSAEAVSSTDAGEANPDPFATKVNLAVVDCGAYDGTAPACGDGGDRPVYSGPLSGLGTVDLGDYAAGGKRRYQFSAALDASAGSEYQGDAAGARFVWDAVQK